MGRQTSFDWRKVTWGRPDSRPSVLCSYCSAVIPEDSVPLILWTPEGYAARFCDACAELGFRAALNREPPSPANNRR
jgi:hypothetical protein